MKREPLSKKIRFEVFKRDKFTCQYCGASSPDVILEVDHITPVSKGGTNDLLNLITSCRNCNRGKTNKELSDDSTVKLQKKRLDELQERKEQREMMIQWRESLVEELNEEVESISNIFMRDTAWKLTDEGKRKIKILVKRFGYNEVYNATEISLDRYYKGSIQSWDFAFSKIGGICYNRKIAREYNA